MSDDAVTATLTTAEIISRLRAKSWPLWLADVERLEIISSLNEARDEMERLTAERDALRAAIVRHRENVWGSGPVGHDEDEALYAVLAGGSEPGVINKRDAEHG